MQQIPTHLWLLHWGVSILTRLYPAKNILALTQTHNSQSWCHRFIKLFAELCYKLVQNNWTNTLYIKNSLIYKVVPISTFHHAKFCLSIWKERVNLATDCAKNQTQCPQSVQGNLNSPWKTPEANKIHFM